jgi:hypothetical protein
MQGGLDYIMLRDLSVDGIRTIGSVLGQSIALDYYIRQVCTSQYRSHGFILRRSLLTQVEKTP